VSRRAHDDWHIEGAVLWDLYRDLKDAEYQLIGTAATEQLLARSGIGPQTTVVFYGYAPALGFWLMKLYGHQDVRILDCLREAWRDEGHPVSSQLSEPAIVTATVEKKRWRGPPSAVPRCSVETRSGPACLYPSHDAMTRLGFLGPPRW